MAITWRDIAAPDFRGAAAITAGANEAIQNSFKGLAGTFDKFGQQFVDKDTNAAIRAAMGLNSIGSLETDRANVLANAGRDADVIKLNQIMQQRADALQGTEKFNQETKANDQRYRIGEEALIDTGLNRARKIITDNQADTTYAQNLIKLQQEVDSGKINLEYLPKKIQSELATAKAQQNSANASAGASNASSQLSKAQLTKLNKEIASTDIVNAALAKYSTDAVESSVQRDSTGAIIKQLPVDFGAIAAKVNKDKTLTGTQASTILQGIRANLGIDQSLLDTKTAQETKLATASFESAVKAAAKKEADSFITGLDPASWWRVDSYDAPIKAGLINAYTEAINKGMPVDEVQSILSKTNNAITTGVLHPSEAIEALNKRGKELNLKAYQ